MSDGGRLGAGDEWRPTERCRWPATQTAMAMATGDGADRSSFGCSMHCLLVLCHRIFRLHALPEDALIRALPKYAQVRALPIPMVNPLHSSDSKITETSPDKFSLLGLLGVIRNHDPDLASLSLGIDLTTLGLNLNSPDNLHKTFGSPWSDEPVKGDPEHVVPECYYTKPPPQLHQGYFAKFQLATLFYIFYSMPKDEAQLYAAIELYNQGWVYHREHHLWYVRVANMEPLVTTDLYERGSYLCFNPNTWETVRKDNFVLYYELLEKRPALPQH